MNQSFTFNHTNFTTNPVCQQGHEWNPNLLGIYKNLEGLPCKCGAVLFHAEKCKCCNQTVQSHQPNPNFKIQLTFGKNLVIHWYGQNFTETSLKYHLKT